jgi:hypothetical protein
MAVASLNLGGPSFRGYCLVCCGENEVMSICLKQLDPNHVDDNTSDFALNAPLAAGASERNVDLVSRISASSALFSDLPECPFTTNG